MTLPVHVHIVITINRQRLYCSTCTQMHLFISIPVQFIYLFFNFSFFLMSQADWEPLSTCWSHPAWSSGCPTGTHCTPPKPHKLAKQLPVCSVHFTRLLPGGSYFYFYTSLMGPRHPTAARWKQTILTPMKQSSPALSTHTIGLMPFLAILENVSGYSLKWKNKKINNLAAIMTYCTSRDYKHLFATNMLKKHNNASQ